MIKELPFQGLLLLNVTDNQIVNFMAETDWQEPQLDAQADLKGSAILYGENVSLFYWLIRKPWATFRHFIGY